MTSKKELSDGTKQYIAGKQFFKCANNPFSNLKGLNDCECPMWKSHGGSFDISGYEIDVNDPDPEGKEDDVDVHLQALCTFCYKVKTTYLAQLQKKKKKKNPVKKNTQTDEWDNGPCYHCRQKTQ
jgi:hypothetical protein